MTAQELAGYIDSAGEQQKKLQAYEDAINEQQGKLDKLLERITEAEKAVRDEDESDLEKEFGTLKAQIRDNNKKMQAIRVSPHVVTTLNELGADFRGRPKSEQWTPTSSASGT